MTEKTEAPSGSLLAAWRAAQGPATPVHVETAIRARVRDDLREIGVDVDSPIALEAARQNIEVLARLAGRQMRQAMELSPADERTRCDGLAEAMADARKRHESELAAARARGITDEAFTLQRLQERVLWIA